MPGTSKNLKELKIIQSESLSGRESDSREDGLHSFLWIFSRELLFYSG